MEYMEAAFKPSLRREMLASAKHVAGEEGWLPGLGVGVTAVEEEDFSVDDLLDLSNGELDGGEEEEKDSLSVSSDSGGDDDGSSNSGGFSSSGSSYDVESILASSSLAIPVDDITELEWVSRFVDDSPSVYPTAQWKPENDVSKIRIEPVLPKPPCFPSLVPVKARSRRPRPGTWSSLSGLLEPSLTSSCLTWSSSSVGCLLTIPLEPEGKLRKKERKEKKKKKTTKWAVQTSSVPSQRKCSHCGVQKTPQWRTGPFGPKTLCNACGVRFKSGRLFPEYRPACSRTFSVEIHSNSHRKVLEMRRKKGMASGGSDTVRIVPSL